MKLSTYASILGIVGILYGLGLLCIPVKFTENYGVVLDAAGVSVARGWGIALCSLGLIYFLNRNIPAIDSSWKGLLASSILFNLAGVIMTIMNINSGLLNSMGWSTVAVNVIFGIGSAYFAFKKK
jgi:hypothetical protein